MSRDQSESASTIAPSRLSGLQADAGMHRVHELLREAVLLVKPLNPQLASRLECCDDFTAEHAKALEQLICSYRAQSRQAQLAAQQMDEQAAEYDQEVLRMNEVIGAVGIRPASLPPALRDGLTAIAGIANELDLVVVSENSLAAAWGQLSVEDLKASRLQMMLAHKQAELDRMLRRASSSNAQLQASFQVAAARLAKADRQLSQQAMQYWPDMPAKLQKYRDQAAQHLADLSASGLRPELKHHSLVSQHEELEGMQGQVQDKQGQLESFHGLPASQEGARLQLHQMQEGLEALQQRLHSDLGLQV